MNYVVLEMQTYADGTTASLVDSFADKKLAEQKYHTALSYAAVSGLPMHTVMMVTSTGSHMKEEHYPDQEAEPEPEPTPAQEPEQEGGEE